MGRRKTVVVLLNMDPGNDRNENVRQEPHRSCEVTPRAWAVSSSGAKNWSERAGAAGSTRRRSACSSQQRACLLAVQRCARSESWEELQGVLPLDPGQIAWVQERVVQQGLDQALDIRLRQAGQSLPSRSWVRLSAWRAPQKSSRNTAGRIPLPA